MDEENLCWEIEQNENGRRAANGILEEILERPGNFIPVYGPFYRNFDRRKHTKTYETVCDAFHISTLSYISYYYFLV